MAYWPLHETSDTRFDVRGSNHLLEFGGNVVSSAGGKVGNAAQFIKSDLDFLNTGGDPPDLSMGPEQSFTIAMWVYLTSTSGQGIITKATSGAGSSAEYALWLTPSQTVEFYVSDGSTLTTVGSEGLSLNTWQLIIAWHDAVNNEIAITIDNDNSQMMTKPHTIGSYDSSARLELGTWDCGV